MGIHGNNMRLRLGLLKEVVLHSPVPERESFPQYFPFISIYY